MSSQSMKRLVIILVSAFVLLGCSTSEDSLGFSENTGPIDPNLVGALEEGQDPSRVPETQRNFLAGCVMGATDRMPDLVAVQETGLLEVCGCSYTKLVEKVRLEAAAVADPFASSSEIERDAYKRFKDLDEDFQATEGSFNDELTELFASCIRKSSA